MKSCLINYNYSPEWLERYPELENTIYDRSDDGVARDLTQYGKVYRTKNNGDVDYDKLGYLIENYNNLPGVFLWGKTNLFKYVDEEYFKQALAKAEFTPLLKFDHKTYGDKFGIVCKYERDMYWERSDSWFFNNPALAKRVNSWEDWTNIFRLPQGKFIPFAPGGNYILTKDRVHRYSRDFYEEMREMLPYAMHPAEAHACERSYYLLWS